MRVCPICGSTFPEGTDVCPHDGATLRTVKDPLVGQTVGGRYRLISRLGTGGMSSVYLARHVMIDRLVAVKTLRRDLAQDPIQRDRFIREARAVNRINHENIVEITDFGETESGIVYLVMEYVPGEPLLAALDGAPFPPARALHIAEQAGKALGRAHQMGVVHRDLKPENVLLVAQKSGRDFVKILDFGIAKILDAPSLTGSQQIFGTPGYIAPEYIQSTDIDGRADLYSLGVILYEMLTGALPFDYEYPGDLLVKHVTEPPIRPRDRHPDVAVPLEELVLRCLEKNPDERFRDAYHFVDELRLARERLGGAGSWAGMESEGTADPETLSDEDPKPTPVLDPDDQAALLRRTRPEGHLRPELETNGESQDLEDMDTTAMRVADMFPERAPIPAPPAALPPLDRPEDVTREEGLAGHHRWRERYEALAEALQGVGADGVGTPPDVGDGLALAAEALRALEVAVAEAAEQQELLEGLDTQSRDLRSTLGARIDALGAQLSQARGGLESIAHRRNDLRGRHAVMAARVRSGQAEEGPADALLWELAAVEQELRRQSAECDSVEGQLDALREELDRETEGLGDRAASVVSELDATMARVDALTQALREPLERVETFVRGAWDVLDGRRGLPGAR